MSGMRRIAILACGRFRLDFSSVLSKDLLIGRVDPVEVAKTVCVSLDLVAPGNGKT